MFYGWCARSFFPVCRKLIVMIAPQTAFSLFVRVCFLSVLSFFFPTFGMRVRLHALRALRATEGDSCWNASALYTMQNPDRSHAKEAIQEMLRVSRKNVKILCHQLGPEVYEDYGTLKALNNAYQRTPDLDVTVYLRKAIPSQSVFLTSLIAHGAKVYGDLDKNAELEDLLHCGDICMIDNGSCIRSEISEEAKRGLIYFANSEKAKEFDSIFDQLAASQKGKKAYCENSIAV